MLRFDKPANLVHETFKLMIIETIFSGFDVECDSNLCLASGGRVLESLLTTLLQEVGLYTTGDISSLINLIVSGRTYIEH